jgi:hypothetical protein
LARRASDHEVGGSLSREDLLTDIPRERRVAVEDAVVGLDRDRVDVVRPYGLEAGGGEPEVEPAGAGVKRDDRPNRLVDVAR